MMIKHALPLRKPVTNPHGNKGNGNAVKTAATLKTAKIPSIRCTEAEMEYWRIKFEMEGFKNWGEFVRAALNRY